MDGYMKGVDECKCSHYVERTDLVPTSSFHNKQTVNCFIRETYSSCCLQFFFIHIGVWRISSLTLMGFWIVSRKAKETTRTIDHFPCNTARPFSLQLCEYSFARMSHPKQPCGACYFAIHVCVDVDSHERASMLPREQVHLLCHVDFLPLGTVVLVRKEAVPPFANHTDDLIHGLSFLREKELHKCCFE